MALPEGTEPEPPSARPAIWRRILGKPSLPPPSVPTQLPRSYRLEPEEPVPPPSAAHVARKVVTGLPRSQTFKRQQSEQRMHLAPVTPSADERRACSVDRRASSLHKQAGSQSNADPRASAPVVLGSAHDQTDSQSLRSVPASQVYEGPDDQSLDQMSDHLSSLGEQNSGLDLEAVAETQSMTTSQHEAIINDELERTWILNLSMHFRDRSKREKFFVTYREKDQFWRRVTISLDYRFAPPNSLEMDLMHTQYQREKSARIYEAIRESLPDIKFYDTVTNLKLETTDGRLHVHVVEDGNEIINYPRVSQVRHLGCRRIRERDIVFDSHMSGFVYKVCVNGHGLIKKEIPSQDTIDEFLYEVNALNNLRYSRDVVNFYGVVVDDCDEYIKGLLISYASQGAVIDIIYEHCKENKRGLPWASKAKWARQIVQGLADIHDSGFVQGDFTLSNIVIDDAGDAKIIDINRRGCPVGWEPPEATALLEAGHRITMYIGVKSDLYQLGMVLWGLAVEEDEPEIHGRPLMLGPEVNVPDWYRQITEICLSPDPRMRLQASSLLQFFPPDAADDGGVYAKAHAISVDDGHSLNQYFIDGYRTDGRPLIRTVEPLSDWPYSGRTYVDTSPVPYELYLPSRGRSPPSPLPSDLDLCESSRDPLSKTSWAANRSVRPSYTDIVEDETMSDSISQREGEHNHQTLTPTMDDRTSEAQENTGGRNTSETPAAGRADQPPSAAALFDQHETGDGDTRSLEEPAVVQNEESRQAAAPRATMPRLTREQTAFIVELPRPRLSPEAADVMREETEGRQRTADSCTADPVRGEPQSQLAAVEDGDVATGGLGYEPEYVAAQAPRSTDVGVESYDDGRKEEPWSIDRAAPRSGNAPYAATDRSALMGNGFSEYPRQMALPVSLTGVGAAHMGIDDELMREKGIIDDDFGAMVRPTLAGRLMTTESSP
ncbi:kinase [Hirsutella rhossiliensis]|uniref:Kinase n=1 Tax=Hirsutella rhossiliensis TaxID=111463 RepID=A0A9P8N2W0_9HYPO|nr:kinase [Hirsutella rhossiliensis]KAH0965880.1 kinase [Hirsutella rhossiliensis]